MFKEITVYSIPIFSESRLVTVYAQKNPQITKNAEEKSIAITLLVRTNASTVEFLVCVFCSSVRRTGYKELKKDTDAEIV